MFLITDTIKSHNNYLSKHLILEEGNLKVFSNEKYHRIEISGVTCIYWGTCFYYNKKLSLNCELFLREFFLKKKRAISNLFGAYFIIIVKNESVYYFSDYDGLQRVYYYRKVDELNISNDIYTLGRSSAPITINQNALIEDSFQNCTLNEETVFVEINKLNSKDTFEFNLKKKKLYNWISDSNTIQEEPTFENIYKNIESVTKIVMENYKNIYLSLTGGIDSRLILAVMLKLGYKPQLLYGSGNSVLTYTCNEDLEIVKEISTRCNLDLHLLDWSSKYNVVDEWEKLLDQFNDQYKLYHGNENVLKSYREMTKSEEDYFEFGYFGEIFRSLPFQEKAESNSFDMDYLMKNVLRHNYNSILQSSDEFISYYFNKIKPFISKNHQNISNSSINEIFLVYRQNADTHMLNYINKFANSYPILSHNSISYLATHIDENQKKYYKLQLSLIQHFQKSLLKIPFYSHNQLMSLKKRKYLSLEPTKKPLITVLYSLKAMYKKLPLTDLKNDIYKNIIYPFLKNSKHYTEYYKSVDLQKIWYDNIIQIEEELGLQILNRKNNYVYIRNLMAYYSNLYFIKKVFEAHLNEKKHNNL